MSEGEIFVAEGILALRSVTKPCGRKRPKQSSQRSESTDILYLVKWRGYDASASTWEPMDCLEDSEDLLHDAEIIQEATCTEVEWLAPYFCKKCGERAYLYPGADKLNRGRSNGSSPKPGVEPMFQCGLAPNTQRKGGFVGCGRAANHAVGADGLDYQATCAAACWGRVSEEESSKRAKGAVEEAQETLVCADLSDGKERLPIRCFSFDPHAKKPAFTYIAKTTYHEQARLLPEQPATGCECMSCSDSGKRSTVALKVTHKTVTHAAAVALGLVGETSRASPRQHASSSSSSTSCLSLNCLPPYADNGRLVRPQPAIFECNDQCSCRGRCSQSVMSQGLAESLEVFETEGRGWGVRAKDNIGPGQFIAEYVGELRSAADVEGAVDKGGDSNLDSYLFDLDFLDDYVKKGGATAANFDQTRFVLDARVSGGVARFINHSCAPNAFPQIVFTSLQDPRRHRVALFASQFIAKGREITYDYGYRPGACMGKTMFCLCGEQSCRGQLL